MMAETKVHTRKDKSLLVFMPVLREKIPNAVAVPVQKLNEPADDDDSDDDEFGAKGMSFFILFLLSAVLLLICVLSNVLDMWVEEGRTPSENVSNGSSVFIGIHNRNQCWETVDECHSNRVTLKFSQVLLILSGVILGFLVVFDVVVFSGKWRRYGKRQFICVAAIGGLECALLIAGIAVLSPVHTSGKCSGSYSWCFYLHVCEIVLVFLAMLINIRQTIRNHRRLMRTCMLIHIVALSFSVATISASYWITLHDEKTHLGIWHYCITDASSEKAERDAANILLEFATAFTSLLIISILLDLTKKTQGVLTFLNMLCAIGGWISGFVYVYGEVEAIGAVGAGLILPLAGVLCAGCILLTIIFLR